ncbi:MAG: alpha amylase C-terminal domain-containing protein [Capsulimonadales bacterium]|nr:alpha amylase C-terminal domain-containing protein [Capsulimonadales bacterium]
MYAIRPLTIDEVLERDPYLSPHREVIERRAARYRSALAEIAADGGLHGPLTQGHHYFGIHRSEIDGVPGIRYREWAPGADRLFLIGDFNGWDRQRHPLTRDEFGVWSLFLPDGPDGPALKHASRVKVHVVTADGGSDRIPAYIRRVLPDDITHHFVGQVWMPPPFVFRHSAPRPEGALRIYETHIGMAQEFEGVGTFDAFHERILPRIADLGYNAIQLMAIQEHPYYGSFGYHVSNLFAVSSRFGTPEQLKAIIDTAHGLGILVLLDIVHSHAVKNTLEGLNRFDGTPYQYFHDGPRGEHPAWDSLLYDYSRYEVKRFLLSNIRYWLEEFRFDGFRFDGVTSMLYLDHGLNREFTSYNDYFGPDTDEDAFLYLQLATATAHAIRPETICIAEDVSGMPGVALPAEVGGLGFDYRLAMGVPDFWIQLVKEIPEEEWKLTQLYHTLLNRRRDERHVGYTESHDQALVGDQTLAFRLMGSAMYSGMRHGSEDPIVERGIALRKLIELITFALAGEAFLNFMGNEFGHPEWIDFPREGNGFSYRHARRQWSLAENPDLFYADLLRFHRMLLQLDIRYGLLSDPLIDQLAVHEDERQLVFRRGPLVFAFNFHPTESYFGFRLPVPEDADYRLLLDTDARAFGGFGRVEADPVYPMQEIPMYGWNQSIQIYLPNRSAQVLIPDFRRLSADRAPG